MTNTSSGGAKKRWGSHPQRCAAAPVHAANMDCHQTQWPQSPRVAVAYQVAVRAPLSSSTFEEQTDPTHEVSHGLQLQSLSRISTAAVS